MFEVLPWSSKSPLYDPMEYHLSSSVSQLPAFKGTESAGLTSWFQIPQDVFRGLGVLVPLHS